MKINECPICNSKDREEITTLLNRTTFSICLDCGHGYMSDGPDADYSRFRQNYTDEQLLDENCSLNQMAEQRYRHIMNKVNFTKTGKCSILDVGCGYGHFLNKFIFWNKTGIEPSVIEANYLRKMNNTISIHPGDYKSYSHVMDNFREGKDVISAHHVIEHLHDPKDFIRFCLKFLSLNGLLYLTLPTVDDIENYQPTFTDLYFLSHGSHPQIFSFASFAQFMLEMDIHWVGYEKEPFWPGLGNSYSIVLKRGWGKKSGLIPQEIATSMGKILVQLFFEKLHCLEEKWCDYVRDRYYDRNKIAIYGSGTHTSAMLESLEIELYYPGDESKKRMLDVFPLIIDDNPREEEMFGIPIMTLEEALHYKFDGIMISTLASEKEIGKRLKEDNRIKCRVFGPLPYNKQYKE